MSKSPVVLVVDDDHDVADLYATYLGDHYEIRLAYNGREAVEALSDELDIVLLDRRMPDLSGDEVLEEIRSRELDCRVGMVTAVDPDFNIVDMPFDDYVVKPITASDLRSLVESLIARKEYNVKIQEYFSVARKRAALMEEKSDAALNNSEEYQRLVARAEELEETLDQIQDEMSYDQITALLTDVKPTVDSFSGDPGEAGAVDGS